MMNTNKRVRTDTIIELGKVDGIWDVNGKALEAYADRELIEAIINEEGLPEGGSNKGISRPVLVYDRTGTYGIDNIDKRILRGLVRLRDFEHPKGEEKGIIVGEELVCPTILNVVRYVHKRAIELGLIKE